MKINTKTRYGVRAMIEIAAHTPTGGVYQKDIAAKQDISNKYLDHIIHALKVAGLIRKNGHRGGYVLTRPAGEISIYDINNAFEHGICVIDCLNCLVQCEKELECSARDFWQNLNNVIINHYKSTTLEDFLAEKIKDPETGDKVDS
ncbi:MAG: Rrf2 family transcriptional regulator [Bacteroidales bacterium]